MKNWQMPRKISQAIYMESILELWGGKIYYEEFLEKQLSIDLIEEFEESDRETRKEIITDILAMYSHEDFDIGEDDTVGDQVELPDGTRFERIK
jgi:hypothetical protein